MTDKDAFEEWYRNTPLTTTGSDENYFGYTKESLQWAYEEGYQAATERAKERERDLVVLLKDCQQHVDEVSLTVAGACSHARNMGLQSEAMHQKDLRAIRELQAKIKQALKQHESETTDDND